MKSAWAVKNYRRPDARGHFGPYGGRFVPETLMAALFELEREYRKAKRDPEFQAKLTWALSTYAGRPSPLFFAERASEELGCWLFLKREDLNHTGAHKINNVLGQVLLALRMGKKRIIAETGAGQHGLAAATVCAKYGLECVVYMGEEDVLRQAPNVYKMKLLGAQVVPVSSGSKTLKDAINETLRDWVTNVRTTFYVVGSVVGPHPYPMMVRDFQSIIGKEAKSQFQKLRKTLPDYLLACVGGGSNAIGLFYPFLKTKVAMIGVEAAGLGLSTNRHSATLTKGRPGVLHGSKSYLLQDFNGQVAPPHSISAGLDYPGVGPEHSFLKDSGRVEYVAVTDKDALEGFQFLSQMEGIIPALEPAHALGYLLKAKRRFAGRFVILGLSGRGDKDMGIIQEHLKL
ncbi:MAG: tryptophan synthase subunit beta [candidate division Zixibacteria bacterium]|nr:tryptophan synthase subunit beta [candidate division Zixibacteria bacterium]MCI0596729.1 tryptophan synthase subunit beta [candidate division Zixibacteria bacterium]